MPDASIAVIVPATDCPPTLGRVLSAIGTEAPVGAETIAITEPAGAGPAAARNLGAAGTNAEILVFVDSDVIPAAGAIEALRERLAEPGTVAVFGSYDDEPEAADVVSCFRNLLHHHVHTSSPGETTSFWAGLGAVRREAFEAAGGFDGRRFPRPSIEDVELGTRLSAQGRIVCDPAIRGTHLKRWTLVSMFRTDFAGRGIPWTRLLLERAVVRPPVGGISLRFFSLLRRRGGAGLMLAGGPLLALHLLAGALAVPAGITLHIAARLR